MSLALLFKDELKGFYKSKMMLILWIGLPILSIIMFYGSPSMQGAPLSVIVALLVGSIGGLLSAAMLVSSIINEKDRRVYDLFLIRPIKRRNIVLSKFLSTYLCITIAGCLALALGFLVDYVRLGAITGDMVSNVASSMIMALSMMAISCSAGLLIGIVSPSMLVGIVLVMYGANQLSVAAALPALLSPTEIYLPLIAGGTITAVLVALSVFVFNRKQF